MRSASPMDLDVLLRRAVERRASDIHLKVGRPPILRCDGALGHMDDHPALEAPDLDSVLAVMTLGNHAAHEEFRQTGEFDGAYSVEGLPRFRVNGFLQRGVTSFAFRAIPRQVPGFEELHLPRGVERLAEQRHGLVLVTGPTGSGKTTTLASMLDHINSTRRQHIVTIEDPIEFIHEDQSCIVNQREVGLDTASFSEALRRALRQDPDVIMIGELRDSDSAQTALHAAESGHFVLSTMHTLDAAETISRFVEFFPEIKHHQVRTILGGVLRGVISQRLLPRIDGGRVPAVEVMVVTARLADLIRKNRLDRIPEAIADGAFFDMQSAHRALIDLVLADAVAREVAAAAAPNHHDFTVALEQALKTKAAEERIAQLAEDQPLPSLRS